MTSYALIMCLTLTLAYALMDWMVPLLFMPKHQQRLTGLILAPFQRQRATQARKALTSQIENLLPQLYSALRAGLTLDRALQSAQTTLEAPAKERIAQMLRAYHLGINFDVTFLRLAQELRSKDLDYLAFTVHLSIKTGTPMSDLMEKLYQRIHQRRQLHRRVKMLTAQGRAQAAVACGLPVLMVLALSWIVPDFIKPLLETRLGQGILASSVMCTLGAMAWIHRLCRLET